MHSRLRYACVFALLAVTAIGANTAMAAGPGGQDCENACYLAWQNDEGDCQVQFGGGAHGAQLQHCLMVAELDLEMCLFFCEGV